MKTLKICVDRKLCDGCGCCIEECPEGVLAMFGEKSSLVDENYCDGCGQCVNACSAGALSLVNRSRTCRN